MPRNSLAIENFHPTIGSVYPVVEEYLEQLVACYGPADVVPPLTVPPIDALFLRLLASYQPARPYIVDLAAASTWGVSTLLCRTDPCARRVVTTEDNSQQKWRTVLDQYLSDWSTSLAECVRIEGSQHDLDKVNNSRAPVLVIAPSTEAAVFEKWLERAPQAVLVLLGVDKAGVSFSLASLIVRCTDSTYRLSLTRELAPALADSRIALVSRRDNDVFQSILERIGHLFANQFQLLDLIKQVCNSALEQSVLSEPLPFDRAGVLDPQSLTTTYDLRRALLEREQELKELQQSLTYRIIQGIRKLSRFARRAS